MFGGYGSPEGLAEASGVNAYGGFGDSTGGGSSFTQAMKNAWNSYWGGFKNNPGQWREGPITGPYSSPFQSGWGNVDAMTNAYGPGSPVDPMSGGMGNRPGAGWSPGVGQGAFNPNYSGQGSNPMGYGAAAKPGFFGPNLSFDEQMEYGGGR